MFEYIQQNKEWLFSGAGVTGIGILFAWFRHSKSEKNIKPQVVIHLHNSSESAQLNDEREITPATIEKISSITFEMIKDSIKAAPPLQRDDVRKNFIGIKVEWDTFLKSAYKDDEDFVKLRLTTTNPIGLDTVICKVLLSEYKELGILPEGTKIRIHGEIEEADAWDIILKDVKLYFYDISLIPKL